MNNNKKPTLKGRVRPPVFGSFDDYVYTRPLNLADVKETEWLNPDDDMPKNNTLVILMYTQGGSGISIGMGKCIDGKLFLHSPIAGYSIIGWRHYPGPPSVHPEQQGWGYTPKCPNVGKVKVGIYIVAFHEGEKQLVTIGYYIVGKWYFKGVAIHEIKTVYAWQPMYNIEEEG